MKEKYETQEKQRKSQEKRIQARKKDVRELKHKLECNDFELEADHDLIEKLRADKRELQEKVDTLTEELQDYKRLLKENGFDVEEEVLPHFIFEFVFMPMTAYGMALDIVSLRLKTFAYLQTICEVFIACLV
jgi:hypothetical protein